MSSKRSQAVSRSSAARATAVVLEDIRAQNRVVLEAVQGLGQRMDGFEQKVDGLDQKVDGLDHKLERFRLELLERVGRLEDAVRENSREIRALKQALESKADAAALIALEQRVAALERRAKR
jgi:uncharacterized protein YukE